MADSPARRPHLFLRDTARAEDYQPPGGGGRRRLPERDPARHARKLETDLTSAWRAAEARKGEVEKEVRAVGVGVKSGIHLEFVSEPGFELDLRGMERGKAGIKLVNVRTRPSGDAREHLATVFVPRGELRVFEKKLRQYASETTEKRRKPKHETWAAPVAEIRRAALEAFWTDDPAAFPSSERSVWWEVWLAEATGQALDDFKQTGSDLGVALGEQTLRFPDRQVLLLYGSVDQLARSVEVVDSIAELRQPREVPTEYRALSPRDMREWGENLLGRVVGPSEGAPSIAILDTGVNREHPLLQQALEDRDLLTVVEAWGVDDHEGHGTEMAGIVLYEDLARAFASSAALQVPAVLESVKVLPRHGENDPKLWGRVTQQAIARVEIERPERDRCHLMAVAATATRDRGRPSSWSGAVDQLAAGVEDDRRRLIVLAAGNERDREAWIDHPDHLDTSEIHDPGQAWNALTVGAFTERWQITEEDLRDWEPVAVPGDLAPMTSTSIMWQDRWPLKPDLVLEGGNAARDPAGHIDTPDSLGLLTTHYRFNERSLTITGDTSAASAQAARMAGFLQRQYPEFWPETVRALLIHSARWSDRMVRRFGPLEDKRNVKMLVRSCGFGVPSLDRALWSAANRLTLIVEDELQPYSKTKAGERRSTPQLHQMHFHDLPWPRDELQALGDVEIQLRITLSYFVEPSPGERGWQSRYRYSSHGLRFDVRAAQETEDEFRKRLNKQARASEERNPGTGDTHGWTLGPRLRHRGSVHSDVWTGTAADLATREQVGVFPIGGWWKDRHHLSRWNRKARYSLIVTIEAPKIEVDLYTPVAAQVGVPVEISS